MNAGCRLAQASRRDQDWLEQSFPSFRVHELTKRLVKLHVLMRQVQGRARDSAFLASCQVMLMLLVQGPHLSSKGQ